MHMVLLTLSERFVIISFGTEQAFCPDSICSLFQMVNEVVPMKDLVVLAVLKASNSHSARMARSRSVSLIESVETTDICLGWLAGGDACPVFLAVTGC